ncbi:MAG: cobalamin B12-binding domain-containing protein [Promethearchaeota archaeon]
MMKTDYTRGGRFNMFINELKRNVIDIDDDDRMESLINDALKNGADVSDLISVMSSALDTVGEMYENGEYFLAELLIAGDRASRGIDMLKPILEGDKNASLGRIVFGSVRGDIHDIGKTIISAFLIGAGFMVYDLGVEVTEEQFLDAMEEHDADILALSTLLSTCLDEMERVVKAAKKRNMKVIVGGRPVSKERAKKMGADAWAFYPRDAIEECKRLIG